MTIEVSEDRNPQPFNLPGELAELAGMSAEQLMDKFSAAEQSAAPSAGSEPAPSGDSSAQAGQGGTPAATNDAAKAKEAPPAPDGAQPAGILTKDGKHVIPYSELQASREREQQAQDALRTALSQLEQLKSAAAAGKPQTEEQKASTDEVIAQMDELLGGNVFDELPEFKQLFVNVSQVVKGMSAQVAELRGSREQDEQRAVADIEQQKREAIDNNPLLYHWEKSDPAAWQRAVSVDAVIRQLPEWQAKPFAERFEKVVSMVRDLYPGASIPPGYVDPNGQGGAKPAAMTDAQLRAAADAALARAGSTTPSTLSDLPAGAAGEVSEIQRIESMDPFALMDHVSTMTEAQRSALFSRI